MRTVFAKFAGEISGATALEYGIIASLIAVVIVAAVALVGNNLTTVFNEVASNLH